MDMKLKLESLEQELIQKQKEVDVIKQLIKETTVLLQEHCHHELTTKRYNYDGHRAHYYTTCDVCYKSL